MEVEVLLDKQVRMIACGAHHVACTVVHGWVPDEEAKDCMAMHITRTSPQSGEEYISQFLVSDFCYFYAIIIIICLIAGSRIYLLILSPYLSLSPFLPLSCSITVASVVVYSVEHYNYWSKGTVTLYMSASAAILSSQKTIVVNHIFVGNCVNIILYNTLC